MMPITVPIAKGRLDFYHELVEALGQMRSLQKSYFRDRSDKLLDACKKAEKTIDGLVVKERTGEGWTSEMVPIEAGRADQYARLFICTRSVRNLQRGYFKDRSDRILNECRRGERELDELLQEIHNHANQLSLFGS